MWSNFLKINEAVTRNEKTAKHLTYQEAQSICGSWYQFAILYLFSESFVAGLLRCDFVLITFVALTWIHVMGLCYQDVFVIDTVIVGGIAVDGSIVLFLKNVIEIALKIQRSLQIHIQHGDCYWQILRCDCESGMHVLHWRIQQRFLRVLVHLCLIFHASRPEILNMLFLRKVQ